MSAVPTVMGCDRAATSVSRCQLGRKNHFDRPRLTHPNRTRTAMSEHTERVPTSPQRAVQRAVQLIKQLSHFATIVHRREQPIQRGRPTSAL